MLIFDSLDFVQKLLNKTLGAIRHRNCIVIQTRLGHWRVVKLKNNSVLFRKKNEADFYPFIGVTAR